MVEQVSEGHTDSSLPQTCGSHWDDSLSESHGSHCIEMESTPMPESESNRTVKQIQ